MYIEFVEIQNFRKLKSVRIDFSKKTTVFVGANNSGKTSAMVALNYFLIDKKSFSVDDITLSSWKKINEIAKRWEGPGLLDDWDTSELNEWSSILPSIDIWLNVKTNEIYHVQHLLPSLEWTGGLLGVRLRLQPKNISEFFKVYTDARHNAKEIIRQAEQNKMDKTKDGEPKVSYTVSMWPQNMYDFLERRLNLFEIVAYNLDPTKIVEPINGIAHAQNLTPESTAILDDPFKKLIRIDKIDAHRGFSNLVSKATDEDGNEVGSLEKGKLSEQLRSYYAKHIDPSKVPDAKDVEALDAIYKAQKEFDIRLKEGFQPRFEELEALGYPGVTDPKLQVSTKLKPVDGLRHPSALKYVVASHSEETVEIAITLPEQYNGLGYQNLISMVFKLMSFRDEWMLVGKAGKISSIQSAEARTIEPLHLVLVEEPEAHLHVQVQQVFIRKAYDILRKHDRLGTNENHCTQLIVSTHSSHIAHECEFSFLRYFRRKPAEQMGDVPVSTVVNLSEVFGKNDETTRFVSKYIKAVHCDLFFADAAILVEGSAERMLVPHFIREKYPILNQSYITILEIGGSHAQRLKSLLDHLGLSTLIITDLDACEESGHHISVQPKLNSNQITSNNTLKFWVPSKLKIDELLNLSNAEKVKEGDCFYSVKCCFQIKVKVQIKDTPIENVIPSTFEDAFVLENLELIKELSGDGLVTLFRQQIDESESASDLAKKLYEIIRTNPKGKAEFALNILLFDHPDQIKIPSYIDEGFTWLEEKVRIKQKDSLIETVVVTTQEQKTNDAN